MKISLIDIGSNLTHESFAPDRAAVIERARAHGVMQIIVTGASVESSTAALELARAYPGTLFCTAGVHPHHAQLLRESDFVSLHVPLSDATRKLMGEPELKLMKKTAILVNTSRGQVADEAAVAKALAEGWIAGAGLDVFENEPNVNPALLKLTNVTLAPHIASASVDTRREMSMLAARNAVEALEGRRPPTLLNPQLWESLSNSKGA